MGRFDGIEHGADLVVARDLAHAEQRLAVRAALAGLQVPLMRQEGGTLHEEGSERGEREIPHRIGRVLAAPPVGQGLAVTAERGDEAIREGHGRLESQIDLRRESVK